MSSCFGFLLEDRLWILPGLPMDASSMVSGDAICRFCSSACLFDLSLMFATALAPEALCLRVSFLLDGMEAPVQL
ncbi:hypothetical protein Nepgr_033889 [Nepenthes gracilis]|uniref:Uncharacterized protein n=1 Tax=Nepenthes gracilis TaxID=150966 RepID=A0AAD3TL84_NEPGR|nr:hypothetical protein Nepgr_033889 [Nepenthes gracilis]